MGRFCVYLMTLLPSYGCMGFSTIIWVFVGQLRSNVVRKCILGNLSLGLSNYIMRMLHSEWSIGLRAITWIFVGLFLSNVVRKCIFGNLSSRSILGRFHAHLMTLLCSDWSIWLHAITSSWELFDYGQFGLELHFREPRIRRTLIRFKDGQIHI